MLKNFLLAFIPIFVAVDGLGTLPIYISLTHELTREIKRKIVFQSMLTALSLAIGFMAIGKITFRFLGITMGDFMIAGGVILFCIAIRDLLIQEKQPKFSDEEIGAVPIGTPLIVGPGVLTTSLMVIDQYGISATLFAVTTNIALVGIIFLNADYLIRILGISGSRALSKVMALFLAAIAVMMIRKGIMQVLGL